MLFITPVYLIVTYCKKDPPLTKQSSLSMHSHGNSSLTQSTLIPTQNNPPSTQTGNMSEENFQETAIDSSQSPSIPLYAIPDKLTKQKVIK